MFKLENIALSLKCQYKHMIKMIEVIDSKIEFCNADSGTQKRFIGAIRGAI